MRLAAEVLDTFCKIFQIIIVERITMLKKTFTLDGIQELRKAGLYFLYKEDILVYIGVSKNVYVRILEHSFEGIKSFDSIKVLMSPEVVEHNVTEIMEVFLINKFTPKYNKLVITDTFSYYHALPSSVLSKLGKDSFKKANKLLDNFIGDLELTGYEKWIIWATQMNNY